MNKGIGGSVHVDISKVEVYILVNPKDFAFATQLVHLGSIEKKKMLPS